MKIGHFHFNTPLILSPMAGVTDKPFRQLCRRLGADIAVSEMVKSNHPSFLENSRADISEEESPRSIQIIGNQPYQMAETAKMVEAIGADIIDINMGCPAKKFAKKPAGSALMAHPTDVANILNAIVDAVDVPVTLKIRTGIDEANINALEIGRIAESEGIAALAIHGRTRAQRFTGEAEHETTRIVSDCLNIPVLANGDIETPEAAKALLEQTGASGLLIGRAARKNPWLFSQIRHYLEAGEIPQPTSSAVLHSTLIPFLNDIHNYYEEPYGVKMAQKKIGWLVSGYKGASKFRLSLNDCQSLEQQTELLTDFISHN